MEAGLIATLASLGCGVAGLIATLITVLRKWLKEKKAKLAARAETAAEKVKTERATLLAERLRIVTDAVSRAVTEVENMKTESNGRIPAKVKRTMGIVMALDECIKADIRDITREELGLLIDSLVGFTKVVNARDKDLIPHGSIDPQHRYDGF